MSRSKLSVPREHGASIVLGVGAFAALWLAPDRGAATAAAAALVAAFLARGPVERIAARLRPRAWDRPASLAYAGVVALGVASVASAHGAMLLAAAAVGLVGAGAVARRLRKHRALAVEAAGMGALGACGGVIALAGGAPWPTAVLLGGALGCYAVATALLIRTETRPRGDGHRRVLAAAVLALLALAAGASAFFSPTLAVAFAPRGAHAVWRLAVPPRKRPIGVIAVRECGELAMFTGLLLGLLCGPGATPFT